MTVYVDAPREVARQRHWPYKMSAHMMADGEEELHAFARRLGLREDWYQGDHYDITKTKHRLALSYGAVQVTSRALVRLRQGRRAR